MSDQGVCGQGERMGGDGITGSSQGGIGQVRGMNQGQGGFSPTSAQGQARVQAPAQAGPTGAGGAQGMAPPQFAPQMAHPYPPQFVPRQGMGYWPGYAPPPMPGYAPAMGHVHGQMGGQEHGHLGAQASGQQAGHGIAQAMQEITSGGNGLSSLGKLLDFNDTDFWKGALVGAAAVLLVTNEGVQHALFKGAAKGRDTVTGGVDKVKEGVGNFKQKVDAAKER